MQSAYANFNEQAGLQIEQLPWSKVSTKSMPRMQAVRTPVTSAGRVRVGFSVSTRFA